MFLEIKIRKINSVELDGISERSNFNSQVSIEKYNEELDVTENYDNDITDLNASLHSEIIEEHTEPADESLKTNSVSLNIPGIPDKVLCAIYVSDFEFFHVYVTWFICHETFSPNEEVILAENPLKDSDYEETSDSSLNDEIESSNTISLNIPDIPDAVFFAPDVMDFKAQIRLT